MNRSVVLVQPKIGSWDDNPIRKYYKTPLSLLCVSRYLVEKYRVVIIDQRIDRNWKETLKSELALDPICIGTTCLTGEQIKYALEISRFVKENSDRPMVWGGIHASIMPRQTVEHRHVDIVVKGEGELTFYELVEALANQQPLHRVSGIFYKEGGNVISNSDRDLADMNTFPPIPYELIDLKTYTPDISLETSRGCPFRCKYCYNNNFNRGKWRAVSAENVIKEIKRVKEKYNFNDIAFIDDNLFADIKRVRAILEAIVKDKLVSSWGCAGMRLDTLERMDASFIDLLKSSGCYSIETGIETCSDKVLKIINKGITKQRILELNKKIGKHQIELSCNFVVGFPGEEIEDLKETTRAIVTLAEDNPHMRISFISIYQPYPGTELYSECVKLGLREPRSLEDWVSWSWDNVTSWRSKELSHLLDSINTAGYGLRHNRNNAPRGLPFEIAAGIFRKVTLFRFKHFYFGFMMENHAKRLASRIGSRS